jgi:muconate/chloromuconate cycloisomerase
MKITAVETTLLDIPFVRPHHLSFGTIAEANFVLVRLRTDQGLEGLGEAVTLGGPTWGEESVESIQATIERYLAPELIGQDPFGIEAINQRLARRVRGNLFARSALEMACFDLLGKALDQPLYNLLGGLVRDRLPLSWSLAIGDPAAEIAEAERLMAQQRHFIFKIKVGEQAPETDVRRVGEIARALDGRARLRVDANQGWDELTALATIPKLEPLGVELMEQPVPRWNLEALARIAARVDLPIMADESVCTPHDAIALVVRQAADVFALKLAKAGGILASKAVAAIASAAGLPCYIGCMIETGVGTAAYAHFGASTPVVTLGCELFGPLMLVEDIVQPPIRFGQGDILVPSGPGLGVTLDQALVEKYRRR